MGLQYSLFWEFIDIKEDVMRLEGFAFLLGVREDDDVRILLQLNDGELITECHIYSREPVRRDYIGKYQFLPYNFRVEIRGISRSDSLKCRLFVSFQDELWEIVSCNSARYFPVGNKLNEAYAVIAGWTVRLMHGVLLLKKEDKQNQLEQEKKLLLEIKSVGCPATDEALFYRRAYHTIKPMLQREVWLISDRAARAGDNGEAFFRYLCNQDVPVDAYFVLRKDSPDFERLSRYGKVLIAQSRQHKLTHLLADKLISSQTDVSFDNPFLQDFELYRDILVQKKRVFLQHGIIQNDLSACFGRHNKCLSLFITSTEPEYRSILRNSYGYNNDIVKLTGMPRYDYLKEGASTRVVAIMPTWRAYLTDLRNFDRQKETYEYDDSFKASSFFRFYNALINDEQLLKALKKHGYRAVFMPHPLLSRSLKFFDCNSYVDFADDFSSYNDILTKSRLLVTDYSSNAFDFAYMRKPIVYCQFDKAEFFKEHTVGESYFDYEKDGFGEVAYGLSQAVSYVLEYLEHDCMAKDVYIERAEKFFPYKDRNNCQRVLEAISMS